MKTMMLERIAPLEAGSVPLVPREIPVPEPADGEVLVKVSACGVCHTEIDEIEGRTPPPRLPVVPGHQVVGIVARTARGAKRFRAGDRVGVAWIHSSCGACKFCRTNRENLCPGFRATGRDANGGYAEFMTVPETFAHAIPERVHGCRGGAAAVRGRDRVPFARADGYVRRGEARSYGFRRFGSPGTEARAASVPEFRSLRVRPERDGKAIREGARGRVGRGHAGGASRETRPHHRHDTGVAPRCRSA